MQYAIIHELPGRLRLRLSVPSCPAIDKVQVEANLHDLTGVKEALFNQRTKSLLIRYDGESDTRKELLERVAAAVPPRLRRSGPTSEIERKKRTVIRAGSLLLLRPFLPPALSPLVTIFGALPIFRKGAAALWEGKLNVDVLDSAAIGTAMATRDFLTASVISFLLKLSDFLEEWTKRHSQKLLSEMFHTEEEWAWVERGGEEVRINLEEIREGETVVVRMGSLIPVDGTVLDGEALVNQASLTGESLPVRRDAGKTVYAGTAVEEGDIRIRALKIGTQTRAARVVKLIAEAETLKAETQSQSEKLADRVVPYSFLLSALTYIVTGNPSRAASVLLIDYSCAIKLSTPLAILASLARAARHRVLIKGGKYLEKLSQVDAVILDKTGTLTEATPEVVEIFAFNGYSRDYILRQAACVEEHFPHPVANAVVDHAAQLQLPHSEEHAEVEYVLAHGIVSMVHGKRILVGSQHFIHEDEGVDVSMAQPHIKAFAEKGHSVLYVAMGNELAGLIAIHDPLRPEAHSFIDRLRKRGIEKIIMLTGDNEATARTVAGQLAITDYHAEALPETKVEAIQRLQGQGYTVAMLGDGINDSPALAYADVGISMKHGADIAQEACDVLLMEGTLHDLIEAHNISQEAMGLISKNFHHIVTINSAAILLALTGALPPIFSAVLHNMSTIAVGLNALKPLRYPTAELRTE